MQSINKHLIQCLSFHRNIINTRISNPFYFVKFPSLKNEDNFKNIGRRDLYIPASLGIDRFEIRKKKWQNKFNLSKQEFMKNMTERCQSQMYIINNEDLQNMIFICEKKREDLDLLLQMAKMYYASEINKISVNFGNATEYMRLCYYFTLPNEARKVLHEEKLSGFFKQVSSYIIAMTLFYKCGQYEEVINTMRKSVSEKIFMRRYPRSMFTLTMAAYYQMNSPSSFREAMNFVTEVEDANYPLEPKAVAFAAALALKQKNPSAAVELSSKAPWNYFLLKNIKVIALVKVGRAEDTIPILRGYSGGYDEWTSHKSESSIILLSTLNSIENALINEIKTEAHSEFNSIKKHLQEKKLIRNWDLFQVLCEPTELEPGHLNHLLSESMLKRQKRRQMYTASFERGQISEKIEKSFERTGFNSVK